MPALHQARTPGRFQLCLILATIFCGLSVAQIPLAADTGALAAERDFFAGKRLTYIVATAPGGGYDLYARLIGRYLPRQLGVRNVVVKNVPGASHLIGLNKLVTSKSDGLTIGTFNTGLLMAPNPLSIDLQALSWVGKAASEPRVFVVAERDKPLEFNDLRNTDRAPILYATSGLLSASHLQMKRIGEAFSLNIRPIHGFSGPETQMVVIRGDISGGLMSLSRVETAIRSNSLRPLFYVGYPKPRFTVPALAEFAATPEQTRMSDEIEMLSSLGRLTAAPPDISPARLAVLRQAYMDTLTDPDLLAEAARLNLPIDAWDGARVAESVAGLSNLALTDKASSSSTGDGGKN
jgi:tripartite-type tricarboxylate transporter receptor subunit TctC